VISSSEENVWQLCDSLRRRSTNESVHAKEREEAQCELEHSFVVFISNKTKSVTNQTEPDSRFSASWLIISDCSSDINR
jgi:phosphoserine aminotransferase